AQRTLTVRQVVASVQLTQRSLRMRSLAETTSVAADARDARGSSVPATLLTWTSTVPAVATVDTTGRITAQRNGQTRVVAANNNHADTATITVRQDARAVGFAPVLDTIRRVAVVDTVHATARDSLGNAIPDSLVAFDWTSDSAAVVTARTLATGQGLLQPQKEGRSRIQVTAAAGDFTASVSDTLTVRFAYASVTVTPNSVTLTSLNDAATLTDTAFDAHDSIIAPHTTSWTSDNPGVASVTSGGRVTAIANGSTKIRGALDAAAESVTVDVVQAARSVTVTPALVTVRAVIAPVSFHAAVRDAHGSLIPGAGLVWQSLATGIAQIVSAAGDSVRIRGVAEGTATIDARSGAGGGSANGTAQVVVRFKLDSLRVAPANPKFNRLGDTLTFTASGTDSLGSTIAN